MQWPLVELEPPVEEGYTSLLDETNDAEERSETEVVEELPTIAQHTRATTTRRATGSEDAFQNYLRDIRRFGRLTHAGEIELAQQAAAGDELARHQLMLFISQ
jgi:RNA polymerase primary sigma factor